MNRRKVLLALAAIVAALGVLLVFLYARGADARAAAQFDLVRVLVASQLNFWQFNFGSQYLTFGRLRPLHTNAVIFAFVGA